METRYYEVYNQPNVKLVDLRETPILRLTETGIETSDGVREFDIIVWATGFDFGTGALARMGIKGRNGLELNEHWADGPTTFLGLQTRGFPNFFTLVGPHNGSAFCNVGVCGGLQAEWVAQMLCYMTASGLSFSEPTQAAEDEWTEAVYRDFADRWNPILDVFQECGIKFALEVHPTEIAFDIASSARAIEAVKGHRRFGFNYDPSHLLRSPKGFGRSVIRVRSTACASLSMGFGRTPRLSCACYDAFIVFSGVCTMRK